MDPSRDEEFQSDELWGHEAFRYVFFEPSKSDGGPSFEATGLSGNERNRMFLRQGDNYDEVTLVSGIDFREDGRGFVLFDYDRDGWVDLGIISPNNPRFRIVRNRIGERRPKNGFVEVSLVGGQTTTEPSTEWSARDAFGATVLVTTGETKRIFQLSCGEGLSSQNAKRIHVGMGEMPMIDKLEVTWPSGKTSVLEDIPMGERLTIFENPEMNAVSHKSDE